MIMRILSLVGKNFTGMLVLLILMGMAFMIFQTKVLEDRVREANKTIERLEKASENVKSGVEELAASGRENAARAVNLEKGIQRIQAAPDEVGCGGAVHIAVDILRERPADDPQ